MNYVLGAVALASACGLAGAAEPVAGMAWLQGCWAVEGAEPGSGEQWSAAVGGAMVGAGRMVRGGKIVQLEFLQLRPIDGRLAYVVQMPGQAEVAFKQRAGSGEEIVFENPAHDFPQRIIYRKLPDARLQARIEGVVKGKLQTVDFPMKRVSCDS